MFVLSKLAWALLQPGNLLLLLLALGAILVVLPGRRLRRLGAWFVTLSVLAFLAVAVLPLGTWLITPLEQRFPEPTALPEAVDGIVVLGGSVDALESDARQSVALNEAGDRLTAFAALARRYPEARLVVVGGSGSLLHQDLREADFAARLLAELGIPAERLLLDRNTRNTRDDAVAALALAAPRPGETWLLVTSAFHMPRAMGCFRAVGWEPLPYPVDFRAGSAAELRFDLLRGLAAVTVGSHEWLGLLAYWLLDYSEAPFPGPLPKS